MWIEEADSFAEFFRGYLPYYLFIALPIFIIMSPVNPVAASHEFSAFRMQQYDLHGVPHGCRSSVVNLEGRSLSSWSTSRHCVVARLQDITTDQFFNIKAKAGALILVLPHNVSSIEGHDREHIQLLESAMISQEVTIPVYFLHPDPQLEYILGDLTTSFITDEKSGTAFEAMMNTASANGYQIAVSASAPYKQESRVAAIYGRLPGQAPSSSTIVIAAHYDTSAVASELAFSTGAASGVVALLEIVRVLSKLSSAPATRPRPNVLFLLAGAGHQLNYFAAKKWLDEKLDSQEDVLLQDVSYVMWLDQLTGPELFMHVSKPAKADTAAGILQAKLALDVQNGGLEAKTRHKKINLADDTLAWPHERFSIRRMTAFTVSSVDSHKSPARSTLLDYGVTDELVSLVTQRTKVLAESLAIHIFDLDTDKEASSLYGDTLEVDEAAVRHWLEYLSRQPRSAQVLQTAASTSETSGLMGALKAAFASCLSDVSYGSYTTDKREPEFATYFPTRATIFFYSVKPAVFDLILTVGIAAYLAVLYLFIQLFPTFYGELVKLSNSKTVKVH